MFIWLSINCCPLINAETDSPLLLYKYVLNKYYYKIYEKITTQYLDECILSINSGVFEGGNITFPKPFFYPKLIL